MKKALLFSLLLSSVSLNANHVTPEVPKNLDQAALTTLGVMVEKGQISQEELELLVGKDQADLIFAITLGSAFIGAAIYGAVVVGLAFFSRNNPSSDTGSSDPTIDHTGY